MDPLGIGCIVCFAVALVALVGIWTKAFRKGVAWGLAVIFAPVMLVVFVAMHWGRTWKYFAAYFVSAGIAGSLFFRSPTLVAALVQAIPQTADLAKRVDPATYAKSQKVGLLPEKGNATPPPPREVRDLAENETPTPRPVDLHAPERAAYGRHAKELTGLYQQLNTERPRLKPGAPAVAAFNAKAARYQQGLQTLAQEKARLDAFDRAANLDADAANALAGLRACAAGEDYEAFAATLKKALGEYRQTPSFAGIVACARTALPQATADRIAAGLQARAARIARAEFDQTTRQVQVIVNQVPPVLPKVPDGAESYRYGYHPGAVTPDYDNDNLIATRESMKGEYIQMDEAPGVFYRSADCEFNAQTKFFYLSRSVPKKKLSAAEYRELTRLYHLLGQQEKAVAEATPPAGAAERVSADLAALRAQLDGYAMK